VIQHARPNTYIALPDEVERLTGLATEFHGSGYSSVWRPDFEFDSRAWGEFWSGAVGGDRAVAIFCTEDGERDGKPVGFILGLVVDCPTEGERFITEAAWFVSSEAVGLPYGVTLLAALEGFGESVGAVRINMGHLANRTGKRLARIYSRWGYTPVEVIYTKRIGGN
tara:strand:+ start:1175 stop:1675 length:501 start_codon:yes stop_codon:yes gene_type:complete